MVLRSFDVTRRRAGTGAATSPSTITAECKREACERGLGPGPGHESADPENEKALSEAAAASCCAPLREEACCEAGALTPPSEHTQSSSDSGIAVSLSVSRVTLDRSAPPPSDSERKSELNKQEPQPQPQPQPKPQRPEAIKSLSLQQCLAQAFNLPKTASALALEGPSAAEAANIASRAALDDAESSDSSCATPAPAPPRGRKCADCGALLLPTIVHFGRRIPLDSPLHYYERALEHAQSADLIICLGSSLQVCVFPSTLYSMLSSCLYCIHLAVLQYWIEHRVT